MPTKFERHCFLRHCDLQRLSEDNGYTTPNKVQYPKVRSHDSRKKVQYPKVR